MRQSAVRTSVVVGPNERSWGHCDNVSFATIRLYLRCLAAKMRSLTHHNSQVASYATGCKRTRTLAHAPTEGFLRKTEQMANRRTEREREREGETDERTDRQTTDAETRHDGCASNYLGKLTHTCLVAIWRRSSQLLEVPRPNLPPRHLPALLFAAVRIWGRTGGALQPDAGRAALLVSGPRQDRHRMHPRPRGMMHTVICSALRALAHMDTHPRAGSARKDCNVLCRSFVDLDCDLPLPPTVSRDPCRTNRSSRCRNTSQPITTHAQGRTYLGCRQGAVQSVPGLLVILHTRKKQTHHHT